MRAGLTFRNTMRKSGIRNADGVSNDHRIVRLRAARQVLRKIGSNPKRLVEAVPAEGRKSLDAHTEVVHDHVGEHCANRTRRRLCRWDIGCCVPLRASRPWMADHECQSAWNLQRRSPVICCDRELS
jgi:hypothetical protein